MSLLDKIPFLKKQKSILINNADSYYSFDNSTIANNETIFAAVSMLSNAVASAPVSLRRNYEKVAPSEHDIAKLCAFGFNPNMTSFNFIRAMEAERNVHGAAYALKDYDIFGRVKGMYLLKSAFVTPVIERDTNILYYEVRDESGNYYIFSGNIIAVDYISADGYTKGISPISVLKNAMEYDRRIKEFSINQMQYGLKPNLVVKLNSSLNLKDKKALDEYDAVISRFKKSGILYLDTGKEIQDLKASSVIDPKVFEAEQITVKKVASVFNIPVSKLWGDKQFNSAEEADLMYLKDTILPIIRMYEQAFSKGLLSEQERMSGMEIKFSMNGYARANMSVRGEFYFKLLRSGGLRPNEIREWEDLPPYEGGDEFYISKDLVNIKMLPLVTEAELGGETYADRK